MRGTVVSTVVAVPGLSFSTNSNLGLVSSQSYSPLSPLSSTLQRHVRTCGAQLTTGTYAWSRACSSFKRTVSPYKHSICTVHLCAQSIRTTCCACCEEMSVILLTCRIWRPASVSAAVSVHSAPRETAESRARRASDESCACRTWATAKLVVHTYM